MQQEKNGYVFDVQSVAEQQRLIQYGAQMSAIMQDILPSKDDKMVLDIACGPGEWILTAARRNPSAQCYGIDISERMIFYAQHQAMIQGLTNAHFVVANATEPLPFDDSTFDFIHARLLAGFMMKAMWPILLKECYRVQRPGGRLHMVESEFSGFSNSISLEKTFHLMREAMKRSGRSIFPEAEGLGIVAPLWNIIKSTGYDKESMQTHAYVLNCSHDTPAYLAMKDDWFTSYDPVKKFLLSQNISTSDEIDEIQRQMTIDFGLVDFSLFQSFQGISATKPR